MARHDSVWPKSTQNHGLWSISFLTAYFLKSQPTFISLFRNLVTFCSPRFQNHTCRLRLRNRSLWFASCTQISALQCWNRSTARCNGSISQCCDFRIAVRRCCCDFEITVVWFRNRSGMISKSQWYDFGNAVVWFRNRSGMIPKSTYGDVAVISESQCYDFETAHIYEISNT